MIGRIVSAYLSGQVNAELKVRGGLPGMTHGMTRNRGVVMVMLAALLPGCSAFRDAVPASCLGPDSVESPRADKEPINFLRLRREPPEAYQLGPRDVLGIYIEGILGTRDEALRCIFRNRGTSRRPLDSPFRFARTARSPCR